MHRKLKGENMDNDIVIPLEDFTRMAVAEEKLQMLIDALLNKSGYLTTAEMLNIGAIEFDLIMQIFDPDSYRNAVEYLKAKGEK